MPSRRPRRFRRAFSPIAGALVVAATITGIATPSVDAATTQLTENWRTELTQNAFYTSYNNESMSSPAVGDVVGDSAPEVVIGGMDGRLVVLTINGQVLGRYSTGPGAVHSSPALADLNGDGKADIIVGNTHGDVVAFTGSGRELWRKRTNRENERLGRTDKPDDVYSTPAVGDLDNDGKPEVVVASADHHLYAWNHDGTNVPGFPTWQKDTTWVSPSLADVDGDGFAEIIVAYDIDYLTARDVGCPGFGASVRAIEHTGVEKWHTCIPGEIITSSPAVADIDADGKLEIAIGSGIYFSAIGEPVAPARKLWLLEATNGAVMPGWPQDLGAATDVNPAVGNLDGDPELEIVTTAADGFVTAFEFTGARKWRQCTLYRSARFACPYASFNALDAPVSIADVDNDGANEVIAFVHTEVIVYRGSNGAEEARHGINTRYVPNAQPTVVEYGGQARIVVQALDEKAGTGPSTGDALTLTMLSTGTPLGSAPWPMARQNPTRTGSTETEWAGAAWMAPWLSALYADLLGRPIDAGGLIYWQNRLGSDLSKSGAAEAFANTDEWLGKVVDDLYLDILGRRPDAAGRAYWIGRLKAGTPTWHVVSSFFSSPEYFVSVGGTNTGFVDALYQAILGRAPDAAGRAFWIARLDAGTPRGTLSSQVFTSYESGGRRVDGLYEDLLNRAPDPGGRDYWAKYLQRGDEIDLAARLIESAEYQTRAEQRFPS